LKDNGERYITDQIFSTAMQDRDETAKISLVRGFQPKAHMNEKKGKKLQDES